ncbi:hypothetical protein SIM91_01015 [Rhodococcus opacus]|nr:hypothetical protein [Rhodococcus opacus]
MSERGIELMTTASRQLDEMADVVASLSGPDLRKSCPDDSAGDTIGALAVHMAEGYHFLGRFLQAAGYGPGGRPPGNGRGHAHGHERAQPPAAASEVLDRVSAGKAPIGLLADLTDEQLASVPGTGSIRFSDGRRTLEQVIEAVIAHQATHLNMLRRAVS